MAIGVGTQMTSITIHPFCCVMKEIEGFIQYPNLAKSGPNSLNWATLVQISIANFYLPYISSF
jgi:hypothetical protein